MKPDRFRKRGGTIGQYSRAGAAAKGVPNVAAVRKALRRSRGSATLSVPGRPKRKSWLNLTELYCPTMCLEAR